MDTTEQLLGSITELVIVLREKLQRHEPFSEGEMAAMAALVVVLRRRGLVQEERKQ